MPQWRKHKSLLELFSRMSAMFITAVFVIGLFLLLVWGVRFLRGWIENRIVLSSLPLPSVSPPVSETPPVIKTPSQKDIFAGLTQSSFTDLFSGVGWLDEIRTNLYQDRLMTAFIFPPALAWQKLNNSQVPAGGWIEKKPGGEYARCLPAQAGLSGRCLIQWGLELTFQGKSLSLPSEVSGREIANISIGSLDTSWLLGVITKQGGGYNGWVFSFDGENFKKVFSGDDMFRSSYVGTLGFGGSDRDWLAVYGGYEGIAYRVRDGLPPKNISRFFGIRAMNGGFEPVVLRAGSSPTWYVFSLTEGNPQFIKLFQNRTDEIHGVVDLFSLITPLKGTTLATFGIQKVGANTVSLITKVTGGNEEVWQIDDGGFKKDKEYEIISSNINTYPAKVVYARIEGLNLDDRGAKINFFFGGSDRVWQAVKPGDLYKFSAPGRELNWRAAFSPDSDPFTSPFFDSITLHFWTGS